jgi:outer membrane protein assembly factor BamB
MARSRKSDRLYIGIGGHVVAIDPSSGEEIWRTNLKGRTMFVTLMERDGRIYGGANGELFCLDRDSGEIVWHNKLKGLGLGLVSFSGTDQTAAASAAAAAATAAAAAAT